MAFKLRSDEPWGAGVRRLAIEQLDGAIHDLAEPTDLDESIHECRKRMKRVRGLLRLIRDGIPKSIYRFENVACRDVGRTLSSARDQAAMLEALENLPVDAAHAKKRLAEQDADAPPVDDLPLGELRAIRQRVDEWPLDGLSWSQIASGLERTYVRGRKALKQARKTMSDEDLHELRKRVKDRWYQAQILERLWPRVMRAYIKELDRLGDRLGDDHDLAVLHDRLDELGLLEAALATAIEEKRQSLRNDAMGLAARLFADKPDEHVGQLTRWRRAAERGA